jgi:hypothetical protein
MRKCPILKYNSVRIFVGLITLLRTNLGETLYKKSFVELLPYLFNFTFLWPNASRHNFLLDTTPQQA